jgi:hypothetical protein
LRKGQQKTKKIEGKMSGMSFLTRNVTRTELEYIEKYQYVSPRDMVQAIMETERREEKKLAVLSLKKNRFTLFSDRTAAEARKVEEMREAFNAREKERHRAREEANKLSERVLEEYRYSAFGSSESICSSRGEYGEVIISSISTNTKIVVVDVSPPLSSFQSLDTVSGSVCEDVCGFGTIITSVSEIENGNISSYESRTTSNVVLDDLSYLPGDVATSNVVLDDLSCSPGDVATFNVVLDDLSFLSGFLLLPFFPFIDSGYDPGTSVGFTFPLSLPQHLDGRGSIKTIIKSFLQEGPPPVDVKRFLLEAEPDLRPLIYCSDLFFLLTGRRGGVT